MKGKANVRLLSVLLTLAMLVGLMPAAFAASYNTTLRYSADLDEAPDMDDVGFLATSLYKSSSAVYFYIEEDDDNDRYSPEICVGRYTYDDEWLEYDNDVEDVYFDTDSDYTEAGTYTYYIYGYDSKDTYVGVVTLILTVGGGSSSSSSDGDIYAETDKNGYVDMSDLSDEIYDYGLDVLSRTPLYVVFRSWDNGTMYDPLGKTTTSDCYYFDDDDAEDYDGYYLDDAWFEIDDDTEEALITFRVYDTRDNYESGTIIVNGGSSSSGDITYSADYNSSVEFSGADFEDLLSSSQTLSYVTFTLPSSSKGTLYWGNSKLASSDKLDSDDLDDVSFTPKSGVTGNVSISFKLYYTTRSSSRTSSMSGTVVISIDDGSTLSYTCDLDGYVELDSYDFDDICYELTGRDLDYVKFSLPSSSKGTLYAEYDGTSSGSTAAKSSDKFYVDPGSKDYALDDVVFVPKTSGTVEFSYTAYNTKGTSFTGKVKISVSAGSLNAISYTATNGSVTFSASDFTTALRAKTSRSLSYVTFTLPSSTEGTLYYNGTTRVTASTQYKATGTTNSLDKVSFVPATGTTGSVTINYKAVDTSGNAYNGTVVVKTFVGVDTTLTYSTTGAAVTFVASDFTTACTKKLGTTLSSVQFTLPSSSQGTLYYGYGSTQQTRVSATSMYLTNIHLPYISFLPKAGFSGTVTISYTGNDILGNSYVGTIQVTVTPPTTSAYFTDATASWVAPSADFLKANGVYDGVVSGTTLGVGTQVTRGEIMQLIYNAFNLGNQVSSVASNFTDVPSTHPYYTAINTAYQLGITEGVGNGQFSPDTLITRQDACTLLYRAFTKLGLSMSTGTINDLTGFSDYTQVASYAVNGVAGMVKSGIIVGDQNGINPLGNLTRGEVSVIIHRAMTL